MQNHSQIERHPSRPLGSAKGEFALLALQMVLIALAVMSIGAVLFSAVQALG
jgi:hypothetical protein